MLWATLRARTRVPAWQSNVGRVLCGDKDDSTSARTVLLQYRDDMESASRTMSFSGVRTAAQSCIRRDSREACVGMASFAVHVMAREFTGREDVITSSSEHSCHYESPRVNAMCVGLLWSSEPISCPRDHKSQDSIVYDVRWQVAHPSEYNDAAESRIAGLEASSMAGHCSLRMWNSLLHKSQQDAAEIDARVKSSASSTSLLSVLQTSATIAQTSPRDIVLAHGDLCTHDLRGMCHRQAPSSWRETSIRSSLSLMSSIDHEQRTLTPRVLGASKFSNDLDHLEVLE